MKKVRDVALMILIGFAFWALMQFGESRLLEDRVVPAAGTKLPQWLDNFQRWSTTGIGISTLSGLVWYGLGDRAFKFYNWSKNFRPYWFALLLVPLALTVLNSWKTPQPNEGGFWAYIFYFLNNILTFYLATLLFSPPPVMYTPPGAELVRRYR